LNEEISNLQSVINFNEETVSEAGSDILSAISESDRGDITDELTASSEVTCWTCGTTVQRTQIEETVDHLRDLSQSKVAKVNKLKSETDELQSEKQNLKETAERRQQITEKLADIDN